MGGVGEDRCGQRGGGSTQAEAELGLGCRKNKWERERESERENRRNGWPEWAEPKAWFSWGKNSEREEDNDAGGGRVRVESQNRGKEGARVNFEKIIECREQIGFISK